MSACVPSLSGCELTLVLYACLDIRRDNDVDHELDTTRTSNDTMITHVMIITSTLWFTVSTTLFAGFKILFN